MKATIEKQQPQSFPIDMNESFLQVLNAVLALELRRSPLISFKPRSRQLFPVLVLIDADSMSEEEIHHRVTLLLRLIGGCQIIIGANRPLTSPCLCGLAQDQSIEILHADVSANAADHLLIERGKSLLLTGQWGALFVFTQDRDLFEIILHWKGSGRPALLFPLRSDDSTLNLIQRAARQGISSLKLATDPPYLFHVL